MKLKFIGIILGVSVLGLPVSASTLDTTRLVSQQSETTGGELKIAHHTHRHRHCHVTLSLGHLRRKCHTHHHNPILHHGIQFH